MSKQEFERHCAALRKLVDRQLASVVTDREPRDLHGATRYVLTAPGKRVRATLLLLSCGAVGGNVGRALHAATAIEMLHNFTLVHDDVMDNAPSRRGRATVHIKWDVNNAILVGDVILGLAYRQLLRQTFASIKLVAQLLTDGFVEVCEGQALDMEFEQRSRISIQEYYRMIDKKTGKMIAAAAEMGGVIGNGNPEDLRVLRLFGRHIGRAFQIQDDLLDVIAKERRLGKRVGGDIVEGKKTFLMVMAAQRARAKDATVLRSLTHRRPPDRDANHEQTLVRRVTSLYQKYGVIDEAHRQIQRETTAGLRALQRLPTTRERSMLEWFAQTLVQRTF